jgi:hypothetical protein
VTPDAQTQVEARAKLEVLQGELAARESTVHFAYAAIALVVALLASGATGKLFWDLPAGKSYLGIPAVCFTWLLVIYSLLRYRRGKRVLAVELGRFETLKALRHTLNLDNPSALLPR